MANMTAWAATYGTLTLGTGTDTLTFGAASYSGLAAGATTADTLAPNTWIYFDATGKAIGSAAVADIGTADTDAISKQAVGRVQSTGTLADNATSYTYQKITFLGTASSKKWIINNSNITDVSGTDGVDDITIQQMNGTTHNVSLSGGKDTLTFTGTSQAVGIADTTAWNTEKYVNFGTAKVTLGANSNLTGGTITSGASSSNALTFSGAAATTGGITLSGATFDTGKFTLTGGDTTNGTSVQAGFDITGGATVTNNLSSIAGGSGLTVSVTSGTYTDASLSASDGTYLKGLTKNGNTYASQQTGDVISIAGGKVSSAITINDTAGAVGADVEITELKSTVAHTTATQGTLNLRLTDANNTSYHYDLTNSGGNQTTIYGGDMAITESSGTYSVTKISGDSTGAEWSIGNSTATLSAKTGSAVADEITLDGTHAKTELTTGSAGDTIILGKDLATNVGGAGITIKGGNGVDVFDISKLAKTTTAKGISVTDYGDGKQKNEASDSDLGFDKIYAGTFDVDKDVAYDGTKGNLVINGVSFSVANKNYVLIGTKDATTGDAVYNSYLAEGTKLYLAQENVNPTDTTSGSDYKVADATATKEYDAVAGTTYDKTAAADATSKNAIKTLNEGYAAAGSTDVKKLTINGENWGQYETAINMGSNGTSYVEVAANASPTGEIKMGSKTLENNIVLMNTKADLSNTVFSDYKSTKDVIISETQLEKYTNTANDSNNFISSTDGSFGSDLMTKNGSLVASSVKGGLYGAKYRQADIIGDAVRAIDNEILVVAGASAEGSYDATSLTTQVFALTNNNDTIADSVTGSKYNDVFVSGDGDVINGGAGNDKIYANSKKVTVKLATGSTADKDTVYGWKSGSGTIQLASGVDFSDLSVATFDQTNMSISVADGTGNNTKAMFSVDGFKNDGFITTFANDETSKKALIYGANGFNVNGGTADVADSISTAKLYVAADGAGTLDFTGTGKGNIFLGHSDGASGEFGDTAQYVNVKDVKSDSIGSAWVFGGSTKAKLTAGGDSDSIWGGGKNNDTLVSNGTYRTFFGTTNGAGVDSVVGFKTGADAFGETTDTDVIYFVDGVDLSAMKVSGNNLVVGSSSTSALAINIDEMKNVDDGALITYALGLDGKKNVAKVDVTKDTTANGTISFDEKAQLFVGRGDKTTLTFGENNGNPARFGFDSQFNGYNIRNLDATDAVAGSLINGSTDRAQRVTASDKGACSIAGGFGDGFKDGNSDTLVGGNDDSFETKFFVGKDMGSDQILKLSGKDTVVFLNTKLSDITNNVNTDTYGKTMSVVFNTGSRVSINSDSNIADLEGVTLQLADGSFTYDATAKSWVQANA